MADAWATGRRVYVEDPRGNDIHLRVTWHPDGEQFVVSHWQGSVCLAATRVPVSAAPALISLLAQGTSDALRPSAAPASAPTIEGGWRQRLNAAAGRISDAVGRRRTA